MNTYLWLDCENETASATLNRELCRMLSSPRFRKRHGRYPVIFLCIGTPKIPGDCLGPCLGSLLSKYMDFCVMGTLSAPVHAGNLKKIKARLRRDFPHSIIIAIDAAIGTAGQMGYITLRRGPLKPGLGLGKKLPPIGHIQITGVFQEMYGSHAQKQMENYCLCLFKGLSSLFTADL